MSTPRLSDTSFVVLGLLEAAGNEATPYDLKQFAKLGVFDFWSVPHTQIYTECERLAEAGLLSERREQGGRRRRFYRLTEEGRMALERWRQEPTEELYDLRDLAGLKLFFGAPPGPLAEAQLRTHERKLAEMEGVLENAADLPEGMRLALEWGIASERNMVSFWSRLVADA
jgi:PadR family transcriptional regulator, regulatory protein AphA